MEVYIRENGDWRFVHGPADLAGRRGDLRIKGDADELAVSRWAVALGVAVALGASVTREEGK